MMFEIILKHIYRVEGEEFTNHPLDRGGPTKYGITLKFYSEYLGRKATLEEIKNIDEITAENVYRVMIWGPCGGGRIDSLAVSAALFDQAVHRGVYSAVVQAQRVAERLTGVYLKKDGLMGPVTAQLINSIEPDIFFRQYIRESRRRYIDIVQNRPSQIVFLKGWICDRLDLLEDFTYPLYDENSKIKKEI